VGVGRDSGGPPWTIDMVITAPEGPDCGRIEYPSLGCGGTLHDCRREDGAILIREHYTHNPGTCAPAGRLEIRCQGDTLDWRWDGQETVRTTLTRASR